MGVQDKDEFLKIDGTTLTVKLPGVCCSYPSAQKTGASSEGVANMLPRPGSIRADSPGRMRCGAFNLMTDRDLLPEVLRHQRVGPDFVMTLTCLHCCCRTAGRNCS
ncbi:MAG: hypothetical protein DMF89_17980 [Acidobacteria bacterium]|nr:MAG: hypothetical protein DMF90_10040 [Acidobacteriota bacterium]PYR47797.1 MAG: hypothetical protein DMF89_17980 [Acidobacteriota bacterium]